MAPRKNNKKQTAQDTSLQALTKSEKQQLLHFVDRVEAWVNEHSGLFPYSPYEEVAEASLAQLVALQEQEEQLAQQRAKDAAEHSTVTPLPTGFNDFRDEA